jgi:hypothetical protein
MFKYYLKYYKKMGGDVIAIIVVIVCVIVIYSCKCFSAKDAKVHP